MQLDPYTKTGAAINRRTAKKNPQEVLYSMMESDRTASKERLFAKWRKIVEADDDHMEAVLSYAFTNYYSQNEISLRPAAPRPRGPEMAERRERISRVAKHVREKIFLDMVMPNDKKMGDCTCAEISTFGDMYKLIAAQGKPSDIIREILTNADIHRLLSK